MLAGHTIGNGSVSSGDIAITTTDNDPEVVKIIGIVRHKAKDHYGLLISFSDFEKLSKHDIKGTELKILDVANRKSFTEVAIQWTGDLADDCTANWAGLLLRAECMDEDSWWWAVYDMQNNELTIDSSINYIIQYRDGYSARQKAEDAAKKYLNVT